MLLARPYFFVTLWKIDRRRSVLMSDLSPELRKLLRELLKNSRATQKVMGARLNLSPKRMSEGIAALEERGIIKKFTADIDYAKLGYVIEGFFLFSLKEKTGPALAKIKDFLSKQPSIIEVHELFGRDHDFIIKIMCKDNSELRSICEEINDLDNIKTEVSYTYAIAKTDKKDPGVPI
jgi:Lrp/AsnC family transcriptional regulator, leucine-responsive regulatory protein